jgi:hypothetical protein
MFNHHGISISFKETTNEVLIINIDQATWDNYVYKIYFIALEKFASSKMDKFCT